MLSLNHGTPQSNIFKSWKKTDRKSKMFWRKSPVAASGLSVWPRLRHPTLIRCFPLKKVSLLVLSNLHLNWILMLIKFHSRPRNMPWIRPLMEDPTLNHKFPATSQPPTMRQCRMQNSKSLDRLANSPARPSKSFIQPKTRTCHRNQ